MGTNRMIHILNLGGTTSRCSARPRSDSLADVKKQAMELFSEFPINPITGTKTVFIRVAWEGQSYLFVEGTGWYKGKKSNPCKRCGGHGLDSWAGEACFACGKLGSRARAVYSALDARNNH